MGRRGPLPKPDNVRRLHGTARKAPSTPLAVIAAPTPPRWLSGEGKAELRRIVGELERLGLVAKIDRAALSLYCDAWSKWTEVSRALAAAAVLPDPTHPNRVTGGVRRHPLWWTYNSVSALVLQLARELGLSASSRLRLRVPEREEPDADDILD
jgi:P27 family predicted phage terminase small subunit